MKIKEIKISNVLSFALKENFDTEPADIEFGEKLNVIVGANGSGKSNFAEVIFTLFQSYFLEQYNYNYAYDSDKITNPNYLQKRGDNGQGLRLSKHIDSEDKESHLLIKILLGDADKANLNFIKANIEKLDGLVQKYLPGLIVFSGAHFDEVDIDALGEITFKFVVKNSNKAVAVNFSLVEEVGNRTQEVINFYLKNFDLIRKLVDTGINRETYDWEPLMVSFEFLGSHRLAGSFPTVLEFSPGLENNIGNLVFQKKNTNIKNNTDTSFVFGLTNAKVGNQIRKDNRNLRMTLVDAIDKQFTESGALFVRLNELLKEYLDLSIRKKGNPSENTDSLGIELYKCANNKLVDFEQLSSGQKSIFTLIFLVITTELENGFLMIDEPEIHLHPRLQKKYFALLKDFSSRSNLQSILITHSPVFIDEDTIKNTYRFFNKDGETKIIRPNNITTSDEDLIRFLSYTNSSKIFFTKKVILVEGDTDSYFYTYLTNNHFKTNEEIEFLVLGGKDAKRKEWFEFLDKFSIPHYLITDFDFLDKTEFADLQVKETREKLGYAGLSKDTLTRLEIIPPDTRQLALERYKASVDDLIEKKLPEITEQQLLDIARGGLIERQRKVKFSTVAEEIQKDPILKAKLEAKIVDLKTEGIYVLRWGCLEDYLAISKGLQNVVDYCADNKYPSMDPKFQSDLKEIFDSISAQT